jgi:EAL domain-containing protein (putative c-di-GMP-specific phosphodiesterase class I)
MKVAERIQDKFGRPFLVGGQEISIEASVGISWSVSSEEKPKDLLRRADAALYRAKSRKSPYRVHGPTADLRPRVRSQGGLELKGRLRRAIERREFVLFYQPMVRLGEVDTIVQTEALLRWEPPERRLLPPGEFMPVVSSTTGLIVPVGSWVLREACRQATEWQERHPGEPPLSVCVQLSAEQIRYPGLIQDVGSALSETGLAPDNLLLEITESTLMQDTEANEILIGELKALGTRLAIDDFGREYSSLSYFKRLPVDVLKIDQSFVEDLGKDPRDTTIVEAMISLSHSLGLEAAGEGVENAEQLEHLRRMGCDLVQGHYLARPMPGVEVDPLLENRLTF